MRKTEEKKEAAEEEMELEGGRSKGRGKRGKGGEGGEKGEAHVVKKKKKPHILMVWEVILSC